MPDASPSALDYLKVYKKGFFLFLVPVLLSPLFYPVDNRPIICPPPCGSDQACKKALAYANTICTPRCLENSDNNEEIKTQILAGFQKTETKRIIEKVTGKKLPVSLVKNDTHWNQIVEEIKSYDSEFKSSNKCLLPSDNTVDSMDYADPKKRAEFDKIYNYKIAACLYCTLLMSLYWIFELIPLAVTALLPLILFPVFGVLPAKSISKHYFNDIIALFFGGLSVAAAIEFTNLHQRIALSVLRMVGSKPRNLLFGFMTITCFLAMWISNVATAAMIFPTAIAVIEQLQGNLDDEKKEKKSPGEKTTLKNSNNGSSSDDDKIQLEIEETSDEILEAKQEAQDKFSKALTCGIGYAASIGGTGMLTGCAANMIFAGMLQGAGISFASFAVINLPVTLILIAVTWLWLDFYFLRGMAEQTKEEQEQVEGIIKKQYKDLGTMTYQERSAATVFAVLVFFWLTRSPGFIPGWGDISPFNIKMPDGKTPYIRDSTVAMTAAFILFCLPGKKPDGKTTSNPLISFKKATETMSWTVIFLLGGGFAMAAGVMDSGLANYVGAQLEFVSELSPLMIVLICAGTVSFVTQLAANTATITIFLPIIQTIALKAKINPLYLMATATTTVSHAFMLPVSTPPNALASGYGYIKVPEMMKAGIPLAIFGTFLATGAIFLIGPTAYPTITDECAQWWQDMANSEELRQHCMAKLQASM